MKSLYDRDCFWWLSVDTIDRATVRLFCRRGWRCKRNGELLKTTHRPFCVLGREHCTGNWASFAVLYQHALQPGRSHLLAGGSAPLPGLTEAVTQHTGFASITVNPFDGEICNGVRLKKMVREAPSYLTSCGLAMRRFLQ